MTYKSILDMTTTPTLVSTIPTYMIDLNVDQIVKQICMGYRPDLRLYFQYFPESVEGENYRREIYGDVKKEAVEQVLLSFKDAMEEYYEVEKQKSSVRSPLQKSTWHVELCRVYCKLFDALWEKLNGLELTSRGLLAFQEHMNEVHGSDAYTKMKQTMEHLKAQLNGFRVSILYENDRLILADYEPLEEGQTYEQFLMQLHPNTNAELKNLFGVDLDFNSIERAMSEIMIGKHPDFFREVAAFHETYKHYYDNAFLEFAKDIDYYLAVRKFQKTMEQKGYAFTCPNAGGRQGAFFANGLYDLALAVRKGEEQEIVSNSFAYGEKEKFFLVTGSNQGGKTTFARSLGQLVYFYKMGLDVPAKEATVPDFDKIMTHFSVEESVETGRGKLMEELSRLSPMMKEPSEDALVIINELFTTAANYDAVEMGTRTLRRFIEKGYRGVYVTHLGDLCRVDERVICLMAQLGEDKEPNFTIERREPSDVPNAIHQVNKHKLHYEQIKERLS